MLQTDDRAQQEEAIRITLALDGMTDAHWGISPRTKDSAYLAGYFEALKQRVLESNEVLQIQWLSQPYPFGAVTTDEF